MLCSHLLWSRLSTSNRQLTLPLCCGFISISDDVVHLSHLLLVLLELRIQLLVRDLLEQQAAETRFLIEARDLVPDHLVVFVALLHLDVKQSIELLVQLHELFYHLLIDGVNLLVDRRIIAFRAHGHLQLIAKRGQNSVFSVTL